MTDDVLIRKATGYVVVDRNLKDTVQVRKATGYVVVDRNIAGTVQIRKATGYVVVGPDASGNLWQPTQADRPAYSTDGLPHLKFDTGKSFEVAVPVAAAGPYTALLYRPNDLFDQETLTLTSGVNTLTFTGEVNQLILLAGFPAPSTINEVQAIARDRATRPQYLTVIGEGLWVDASQIDTLYGDREGADDVTTDNESVGLAASIWEI